MSTNTEKIVVQVIVQGQKQLDNLEGSTKKATKSFDGLSKKLIAMTGGLFAASTAFRAISKVISSTITTFTKFEFEMAKVRAITGSTDKDFQKLSSTAQNLGKSTFFTSSQVAELQVNFGKLGFSTQEILNAQEATLLLATATQSDLGRAAIVAGAAVRGFGLDASETARVVDVMAVAFTSSALDIEKFQTSMTKVAPISAAANISLEATTAVMGTLTDAGIEASIAGTSLRNIFLKLADPTSDLAQHLGFTVNSSEDLEKALVLLNSQSLTNAEMMELVDLRQVAAFATMVNGVENIQELTNAFDLANGAAQEMADIMADTLQGDILVAKSAWEGLQIAIVEGSSEISKSIRNVLQVFALFSNNMADDLKNAQQRSVDIYDENIKIAKLQKKELLEINNIDTKLVDGIQTRINDLTKANAKREKESPFLDTEKESKRQREIEATKIAIKDLTLEIERLNKAEIQKIKNDKLDADIKIEKEKRAEKNKEKRDNKAAEKAIKDAEVLKKKLEKLELEKFRESQNQLKISLQAELNADKENLLNGIITQEEFDKRAFEAEQSHLENMKNLNIAYGEDVSNINSQILDNELDAIEKKAKAQEDASRKLRKERKDQIDDVDDLGDALIQLAGENQKLNKVREVGVAITQAAAAAESFLRLQEILSEITKGKLTLATILGTKAKVANTVATTSETVATGANTVATGVNTVVETASIVPKIASGAASQTKLPFPLNIIAVVATLALLSKIMKSFGDGGVIDTFANGGMVHGNSHAQGGEKFAVGGRVVELEGGEAVINKRSTAMFRNQLSAMNSAGGGVKFADGGLMNMPSFAQSQFNAAGQAGMMGAMGQSSRVVVVESDITTSQNTVSVIEAEATI